MENDTPDDGLAIVALAILSIVLFVFTVGCALAWMVMR